MSCLRSVPQILPYRPPFCARPPFPPFALDRVLPPRSSSTSHIHLGWERTRGDTRSPTSCLPTCPPSRTRHPGRGRWQLRDRIPTTEALALGQALLSGHDKPLPSGAHILLVPERRVDRRGLLHSLGPPVLSTRSPRRTRPHRISYP